MRLKSLEINGYKSFNKKGLLEFTTPITAIVGPNGSGKSNVVEAFRFVLGEQSMKAMRGQKGEDMIFNGSQNAPRANRATVRLVLDNADRIFNVDFNELLLERTVYRDGDNEYRLNGDKVRLKDVVELLSAAHIGISNHHIISQGQADRILNAKPPERKEMIEDALGLKIYQFKRRESERKLAKTEENLKEVELLRRELSPRISFLKRQVEKIERANELKKTLLGLYTDYFKRELIYLNGQKQFIEQGRQQPAARLAEVEAEIERLKQSLRNRLDADGVGEKLASFEENLRSTRAEKDRAERELGNLEGQLTAWQKMRQREREGKVMARPVPFEEVNKTVREVVEFLDEMLISESDQRSVAWLVEEVRQRLRDLVERYGSDDDPTESSEVDQERTELEAKIDQQRSKVESWAATEIEQSRQYEQYRQEREKNQERDREAERDLYRLMSEQKDLSAQIAEFRTLADRLEREKNSFHQELSEAGALLGAAVLDYKRVEIRGEYGEELSEQQIYDQPREEQEKRRNEIERHKIRLEEIGVGASSDEVMKEYREVTERDEFLSGEVEDLKRSIDTLRSLIEELQNTMEEKFVEGLKQINEYFKKFFVSMFGGGEAYVKKVTFNSVSTTDQGGSEEVDQDSAKPKEGVEVGVSLPRKKIRGLMMLSGGERALTSVALTFAITQVNPPPFLILDETDAALDEANSRRYGEMIETLSKHSQLIIITHNRETMSRANVLYGVTMGPDSASKLLSIRFDEVEKVAD